MLLRCLEWGVIMTKLILSDAQNAFVNQTGKNILVSASAGSGKTTTMIAKIVKLVVENRIPLKRLLIVTYTNASASELKVKLYNKIFECIGATEDEEVVAFLNEQLESMETCEIGTLHSVCKKIIKKYFYAIEQDSNFALLDGVEEKYLFDLAMNNVFSNLIVENNEDFYKLYSSFNTKRDTAVLGDVVKKIYIFLNSKSNAEEWINYVENKVYNLQFENNVCVQYLLRKFKNIFYEIYKSLQVFYDKSLVLGDKYSAYISTRMHFCLQIYHTKTFEEFASMFEDIAFENKPKITKNTTAEQVEFLEDCDFIIKQDFANALNACKQFLQLNDAAELSYVKKLICNLFDVVELVKNEYCKLKEAKCVLDFSDLEHKSLQILANENIKQEIVNSYDYIFVDEYQDINEIQENILNCISKASNVNMIGDVKQSIYQFRLSNPKLFLNKYNDYSLGKNGEVVKLNENYRSENNILQFVNFVFNEIITENTVGINYKDSAQLVRGGGEITGNKVVSMDIICSKPEVEAEIDTQQHSNNEAEGHLIAMKVADLLGKEYLTAEGVKKLEYKDIAVLLRAKKELAQEVYKSLKQLNIPCNVSFSVNIFESYEIEVLYSMLKILNAHNDDIACAVVLKSYPFGVTDAELGEIRCISDELSFFECVNKYYNEGQNKTLVAKLAKYYQFIKDYRFYLTNHTIKETLENILNKLELGNYFYSMPDGAEKLSNIEEFLNIVSNDDFSFDLVKCLEYLKKASQQGVVLEMNSQTNNAVKIMTLHSSKGLEFPAVVFGGMGKNFLVNHFTNNIIINDTYGVGIKYLDAENRVEKETLVRTACKYANEKDNIDEEIRLLYVGLTRAKNFLCCTGTYNLNNILANKVKGVYASRTYLDLIFKSYPRNVLSVLHEKNNFVLNEGEESQCNIFVHEKNDLILSQKEVLPVIFNEGDAEIVEMLKRTHTFKYPYEGVKNIPVKNSVSSILKEENDYENVIYAPKRLTLFEGKQEQTSLLLGTLYHEVMEGINYTESEEEIKNVICAVQLKPEYAQVKHLLNAQEIITCVKNIKALVGSGTVQKEVMFTMKDLHSNLVENGENVEVIVQGVIDLIIKTNNEVIIVDFKTNKAFSDEELINTYTTQLSLYARAYEKCYNQKVNKMFLYSFTKNKFIQIPKKVVV